MVLCHLSILLSYSHSWIGTAFGISRLTDPIMACYFPQVQEQVDEFVEAAVHSGVEIGVQTVVSVLDIGIQTDVGKSEACTQFVVSDTTKEAYKAMQHLVTEGLGVTSLREAYGILELGKPTLRKDHLLTKIAQHLQLELIRDSKGFAIDLLLVEGLDRTTHMRNCLRT